MLIRITGKKKVRKTDEELLAEFTSAGNLDVLGELYSDYMHLVYGVCLKYLKDRDDSMDAVMQIFEKLITEIPKQKIGNFKSWLFVVTKNFCLMKLRSHKAQEEKLNELINDPDFFMENSSILHPVDEDQPGMEEQLKNCIERLKDEQKECIKQFYYDNHCYNEIAHEPFP